MACWIASRGNEGGAGGRARCDSAPGCCEPPPGRTALGASTAEGVADGTSARVPPVTPGICRAPGAGVAVGGRADGVDVVVGDLAGDEGIRSVDATPGIDGACAGCGCAAGSVPGGCSTPGVWGPGGCSTPGVWGGASGSSNAVVTVGGGGLGGRMGGGNGDVDGYVSASMSTPPSAAPRRSSSSSTPFSSSSRSHSQRAPRERTWETRRMPWMRVRASGWDAATSPTCGREATGLSVTWCVQAGGGRGGQRTAVEGRGRP